LKLTGESDIPLGKHLAVAIRLPSSREAVGMEVAGSMISLSSSGDDMLHLRTAETG